MLGIAVYYQYNENVISGLYLTPASISYLNQFLLLLLITGYFGYRFHKKEIFQRQNLTLAVFFFCVTVLSGLLFLEVSLLPSQRLYAVYLQSTVLAIVMLCLILFAYAFPFLRAKQALERRIALFFFGAYALFEAGYAAWRFSLLFSSGLVEFRIDWMDIGPVLGFLWTIFVFVRGAIQNRQVQASRYFALIFVIPLFLAFLNLLRTFGYVPSMLYHVSISIGVLLTIFFFALNYFSSLPEQTSLMVKFSGVIITVMLTILGSVAWLLTPAYVSQYRSGIRQQVTFRFSPIADGGYRVFEIPFQYERELGEKLLLTDSPELQPFIFVRDFEFEFFGIKHEVFMISGDGFVAFGEHPARALRDFEYRFSPMPVVMAALLDFNPDIGDGGIYLRREPDRLMVTYDRVPGYYYPEQLYTFQIVLRADNTFDITYHTLPDMRYVPNDRPDSSLWAIGIIPGGTNFEQPNLLAVPFSIGPQGWVDDHYRAFRAYLHDFISPLALTILLSSLLVVIGLPILIRLALTKPLEALISGVRAWNKGNLDVQIPVKFNDEVGYLSASFNSLGAQLGSLLKDLESAVDERTRDLLVVNEEMRKLFIAVQQSPNAIVITDLNAHIEYVNPAFEHSTGYRMEEVIGKNPSILKSKRMPPSVYEEMWKTIKSGQTWRGELCNLRKNGQEFWEYIVIAPIRNDMQEITHYVAVKEDVTDRALAEQALKESEKHYRDLFELESDAIFIIRNSDGRILEANNAASVMYGYSVEELTRLSNFDLSAEPEKTRNATSATVPADKVVVIPLRMHRRSDGEVFPVEITARFIIWKNQSVHIAAIRDITERRQAEAQLERWAATDSLTGLYNRRHFYDSAIKFFRRAAHDGDNLTLLMMDIDYFKPVNDAYGHPAGDAVLCEVSHRIQETLRPVDLLARYGGEEFVAALIDIDHKIACDIAERILKIIHVTPISFEDKSISVTISIGVAQFSPHYKNLDEMLSAADNALYLAKQAGRNCYYTLPINPPLGRLD